LQRQWQRALAGNSTRSPGTPQVLSTGDLRAGTCIQTSCTPWAVTWKAAAHCSACLSRSRASCTDSLLSNCLLSSHIQPGFTGQHDRSRLRTTLLAGAVQVAGCILRARASTGIGRSRARALATDNYGWQVLRRCQAESQQNPGHCTGDELHALSTLPSHTEKHCYSWLKSIVRAHSGVVRTAASQIEQVGIMYYNMAG